MQNRPLLIFIAAVFLTVLVAGVCVGGFLAGMAFDRSDGGPLAQLPGFPGPLPEQQSGPGNSEAQETATPRELQELFAPFWQAWDLVNELYVDRPIDPKILMRGAIQGMMESLGDQHSSYLDPEMFKQSQAVLQGDEYEGIGAWVDINQDYLTIISPMPGSPAEAAGLRTGDKVIAIDGEDMSGKDGEYARQHVMGPSGTIVTLTVFREGVEEPFEVQVERAEITVPTVAGRMLEENNIAYVRLYVFGDDTSMKLRATLTDLLQQNPAGLILDLRSNGGGYRDTAVDVASEFIDEGVVMFEDYGDGRREQYDAAGNGLATDIPMVVLVNEGSASASEIVAGALQDLGRAYLVGMTTFGKGSVQSYVPLDGNQGAVRVTVARWLTPNGRTIHELGLAPDFEVEISEQDFSTGSDPQLEQAIQVLVENLVPLPTAVPTPTPTPTPVP